MPDDLLPAGPDLDALVAIQVMGWRRGPDLVDGITTRRQYIPPGMTEQDATPMLPGWSRTIGLAWDVVERMNALTWTVRIEIGLRGAYVEIAPCTDTRHDAAPYYAEAATTSLAICRAALAAVAVRAEAH
jgi:hypothetical protein